MKALLEKIGFRELIRKHSYFNNYTKNNITLNLEEVKDIGLLIEYENENDFTNKSDEEIIHIKEQMYDTIKQLGINVGKSYDIKKAYNLIIKKYHLP